MSDNFDHFTPINIFRMSKSEYEGMIEKINILEQENQRLREILKLTIEFIQRALKELK